MLASGKHLYDFGPFRLDLGERMLLRDGAYVSLTPKAFETLVVLIERHGRIVEKDELLRQIWPDTFVEEGTLVKNVSMLRKALGEAEGRHYIDTFPKRGYRFAAEVRVIEAPEETEAIAPQPEHDPSPRADALRRYRWAVAVVVLLALGAAVYWMAGQSRRSSSAAAPRAIPLTSFTGRQTQVAFSPDGNQIAFVWGGPQEGPPHIYVKVIGSEALLPLTRDAGSDSRPAWSPDDKSIAFLRTTPQGRAWYVTSVLGRPERKIAELGLNPVKRLELVSSQYC